jgi:uncharacterized membrane protein
LTDLPVISSLVRRVINNSKYICKYKQKNALMGFSERFPRWLTGFIAIAQLLITAAIIGLELISDYIDLAHGTIWAGLWSGIVFIITFIMMLTISKYFKYFI